MGFDGKHFRQNFRHLVGSVFLRKTLVQAFEDDLLAILLLITAGVKVLYTLQCFARQKGVHVGATGMFRNLVSNGEQFVAHPHLPPLVFFCIF